MGFLSEEPEIGAGRWGMAEITAWSLHYDFLK
jgi:hypothetical protein